MKVGMLWVDTDRKRSLDEKVQRAAEYYQEKYGLMPDLCLVNSKVGCFSFKSSIHWLTASLIWLLI